ncbi:hypothetical protein N7507_003494 [Penicillium longicatenatum]|nr:hypothetical protein N7507_003494 [Penicillium longicatenatum]
MAQFLRDPAVLAADIIAIQEPWINPYKDDTHHPAKQTHELLWPSEAEASGEERRARVCMFVSKKLAKWTHYAYSGDVQELRLSTTTGEVRIMNIYNEQGTWDGLNLLKSIVLPISEQKGISYLILGDFNLHHPIWGGDNAAEEPEAEELLILMDSTGLDSWLEPGVATRIDCRSSTTIDLTLASRSLQERMISCEVSMETHADSDHLPIRTELDVETQEMEETRRRNWKAMEVEKFTDFMSANLLGKRWMHLPGKGAGGEEDVQPRQIDDVVEHLVDNIQQGVQQSTPWARPSAWAKPGWTPECSHIIKETRQSFRRWKTARKRHQSNIENEHLYDTCLDLHEEYRTNRNKKGKTIKKALRDGYRSWIQDTIKAGPRGLWRVSKWARNRDQSGGGSIIPSLQKFDGSLAEIDEQKAELLRDTFFSKPPEADLSDIQQQSQTQSQSHPFNNQISFPSITEQEIRDAIHRTPPDKAPGPDGIPNRVWKILLQNDNFIRILTSIFNACVRTGYNPRYFQQSITVALRKGGPRNFRMPKSYRPIALMNTLGKVLEAIIALRIFWAVEEHGILPKTHLGGRKGISVDHAIQLILDRVHRAWGIGRKVSMLLLDVSGAYDNVSHTRLLNNITKLRLGHFVPWIRSFLQGRSTRIKLPGFLSDLFSTETGIPQGSPISPILFLLFNAPLIRGCSLFKGDGAYSEGYGWVDDAAVIVESESYARNVEILEEVLQRADLWARRHAAKFAPDKFELIHFTNPRAEEEPLPQPTQSTQPEEYSIYDIIIPDPGTDQLPVRDIQPLTYAKYLGIWLDKELSFNIHRQKLIGKANASLDALQSLTGSTWGASLSAMRTVYRAVVIPQMLYGVVAWFPNTATKQNQIINSFTKIQRRAAIMIAGAFKSMSAAALNIEQILQETAIRIQTGAKWAQPYYLSILGKRTTKETKLGGFSPLEKLRWKKGGILFGDGQWESKTAFVLPPWEPRIKCIIKDSDTTIKSHNQIQSEGKMVFFTDGSGYEGKIGASAVAPDRGIQARRFLGTTEQAIVFTAELAGIEMTLDKFKSMHQSNTRELVIFANSRAAIQAVQNPKRPSGQHILRAIYAHVHELRTRTPTVPSNPSEDILISIRWIPAHVGVPGNELADTAAKHAALKGAEEMAEVIAGSETENLFPRLAATAKQQVRRRTIERWALLWAREKTGKPNQKLVPTPHKKTLKLFEGLPKHYTSILVQMRSMRVALKHFLFKIGDAESDRCNCQEGSQTPKHVLLRCPLYVDERKEILDKIRARTDLRGNSTDYEALLSHPRATRYVAEFMLQTGLLGQFRCCDVEPEPEDDETTGQN